MQQTAAPNHAMAKALLFVGCRSQTKDRLYAEDFDLWQKQGVVDIRYAFSREMRDSDDCAFVHERISVDREDISDLWEQGARIYVCGSTEFVTGVGDTARQVVNGRLAQRGIAISNKELEERFQTQITDRCSTDIFG